MAKNKKKKSEAKNYLAEDSSHRSKVVETNENKSNNNEVVVHELWTKKFQHRTIESNWDRYEQDDPQDYDPVSNQTAAGTKFETLLSQSGKHVTQFQFKDEQIFDPCDNLQQPYQDNGGLLGFDLEKTLLHLKSISVFEKVKVQNVLDELDEGGCKWHGEYFRSLKNCSEMTRGGDFANIEENNKKDFEWNFHGKKWDEISKTLFEKLNKSDKMVKKCELEKNFNLKNDDGDYKWESRNSDDKNLKNGKNFEDMEDCALDIWVHTKQQSVETTRAQVSAGFPESHKSADVKKSNLSEYPVEKEIHKKGESIKNLNEESCKCTESTDALENWLDSILE